MLCEKYKIKKFQKDLFPQVKVKLNIFGGHGKDLEKIKFRNGSDNSCAINQIWMRFSVGMGFYKCSW